MRYYVLREHIHHFQTHGSVFFEGFLPHAVLSAIQREITPLQRNERDMWRQNPFFARRWGHPHFADTAADLLETWPLRLICDAVFLQTPKAAIDLASLSSIEGVLGGWILHIGKDSLSEDTPLPKNPGDALFVSSHFALPLQETKEPFLCVAYAGKEASCHIHPENPQSQFLKQLGYVHKEQLHDELHPLIRRY